VGRGPCCEVPTSCHLPEKKKKWKLSFRLAAAGRDSIQKLPNRGLFFITELTYSLCLSRNQPINSHIFFCKLRLIWGVAMKFLEWFYCKHISILTVYWDGSRSNYSPWTAVHIAQRCCHFWKHFWNSCCGIAFFTVVTFFGDVFSIIKSSFL
jgi:hypothetical protein